MMWAWRLKERGAGLGCGPVWGNLRHQREKEGLFGKETRASY